METHLEAGGIDCAIVGAKGNGMHGANEWVDLKSLEKLYKMLKIYLSRLPKISYL